MFVDDGSWASKLHIKDKAQATALDFVAIVKATHLDSELSEPLIETAKQFSALDSTMKTTRQNTLKLVHILQQVQDANFTLLDNLRATDQARDSLCLQPPPQPSRESGH
ncbi:hypothetical protein EDD11_007142 [Mortierella claussenii]|nr:hypothetical protein EDD11_007142 [Mortierella claussenii]